jgi:type IV pilus assembly protein PilY1
VNAQGTFLNQIFIGMFRPEEEPRWFGNLKQYQFVADVDAAGNVVGLKTGDKNDNPVVSPLTGFITPCAESFWSSDDTYWPSGYQGNCLVSDERSNLPDGEVVEKGGAAQKLRAISPAARIVKTCNSGACTALTNFDATNTNITKALLGNGSMSNDNRADLINWARGRNVDNELSKGTEATVMRPSVHGDVVHSRPLAIDYGGTTGVVVFYGGNDGMFRAINGNKADRVGNSFPAGSELWSFVAPEHFGKLNRLKTNSPIVNFPSVPTSTTPTPTSKDYFFDGPIGVYSSGTTKWIYPTMRRGGRSVYAFDVSTPTGPVLKWKRDENSTGFSNIGQTWSEPKVVKVAGYPTLASATKSPVIIMGGGYDACEDQDAAPNTTCTSPKGNRIYVLDADTGALLQTFNTDRSVVANITVRDSDGDGMTDIAYAVDTGANIYRISIGTRTPSDTTTGWTMTKIAALGCTSAASCDRKFLQAPEVVVTADYNAVLVGSGNRERPLLSNNATQVDNAFFMIKDVPSDSSQGLITTSSTTSTGANSLIAIDASLEPTQAQLTELAKPTNKGWHLAFGSGGHDKEQVVTSAVVIAGVAYFSRS